jgi:heme A synthase
MAVHKFPFGGTSRSFADYYNGFGYILSVVFMMIAITLWMVSGETKSGEKFPKKIVFITAFTLLAMGIIELLLFFPFVMILSLVAGALTLFAGFRFVKPS